MRTHSGTNVIHHFGQVEIPTCEFAPVIAREYAYAGQITGPQFYLPPFRIGRQLAP